MSDPNDIGGEVSDEMLADRVRAGDSDAYAELWHRHSRAARTAAGSFASLSDPDDLVSEAFLQILRALQRGGGPREAFRPYLYRTIRNLALNRRQTDAPTSLELVPDMPAEGDDLETTIITLRRLLAAYDEYPTRRRWQRKGSADEALRAAPLASTEPIVEHSAPPMMIVPKPEMWPTSTRDLERLQRKLARQVDENDQWRWRGEGEPAIGGVFVSLPGKRHGDQARDIAWAAAVITQGHNVVATATATRKLVSPYKPGYLALTVGPILEDVVQALSQPPDIIIVNAAGRDHIRGAGLAIQLGAALDVPTIGVTERPEIGVALQPGAHRGDWTPVRINNRLVGFRVRSLASANPIMAHAAWLTSPETARDIVLRVTGRMRVPEPLQRARQLSRKLRSEYERSVGTGLQDGIHG